MNSYASRSGEHRTSKATKGKGPSNAKQKQNVNTQFCQSETVKGKSRKKKKEKCGGQRGEKRHTSDPLVFVEKTTGMLK